MMGFWLIIQTHYRMKQIDNRLHARFIGWAFLQTLAMAHGGVGAVYIVLGNAQT